jgi:hypothetical protein
MIAAGVDPTEISRTLGHASLAITLYVDVHAARPTGSAPSWISTSLRKVVRIW